jgi:transposase
MRRRGEMVERSFAHVLDRGGLRRAWLRGRANVHERYLIYVAGFNLGILMRALFGSGTPKQAASARTPAVLIVQTSGALAITLIHEVKGIIASLVIISTPEAEAD